MFGFSRGAYTVRTIAGMLQLIGLLRPGSENLLDFALANYTNKGEKKWDDLGAFKSSLCQKVNDKSPYYQVPIRYMGVWDTVKSVGVFRNSTRLAYTDALPNVKSLRHAIALDEKRSKFRPDHATAIGAIDGAVQSMWFKGVHSDIGGGYVDEERGLSDHAMGWIIDGATAQGLLINQDRFDTNKDKRKAKAMEIANGGTTQWEEIYYQAHNSLKPIWWVAGWLKRELPDRIWIHGSAIDHFAKSDVNSDMEPSELIKAIGSKEAHLQADIALIKLAGNLLIQKLTPNELAQLETLPDDPHDALKQILLAGVSSWSQQLETELAAKSFDVSDSAKKRARELLESAAQQVEANEIKGAQGAFDLIGDFIRMTSLKGNEQEKAARLRIIETAPYLLEALAEA